jgi:cyclic pyranopterin phosphate synthase
MSIDFSHVQSDGSPGMVDVSAKKDTVREARAQSIVFLGAEIVQHFEAAGWKNKKGSILQTAIIAGTMAAKKTSDLIPLCHPLGLDSCKFETEVHLDQIVITCICRLEAKTGVEMEALVGASIAALTVYDMCKSVSQGIIIKETKLITKSGGKSDFVA